MARDNEEEGRLERLLSMLYVTALGRAGDRPCSVVVVTAKNQDLKLLGPRLELSVR